MKKRTNKLSLNRETVRSLSAAKLGRALGGSRYPSQFPCDETDGCFDSLGCIGHPPRDSKPGTPTLVHGYC